MKFKTREIEVELSWLDLENMKEMCKAILNTYIAIQRFQLRFVNDIEGENFINEIIYRSKQAFEKVDNIENPESINIIIQKILGEKDWIKFNLVLSTFGELLNSDSFWKFDKELSEAKRDRKVGDA